MPLLPRPTLLLAAAATTLLPLSLAAAQSTPLTTQRITAGLLQPCWVGAPAGDFARLFAIEQGSQGVGHIRLIDLATNTLSPTPYLTLSNLSTGSERGLLGLAFHPDFAANGYFWIHCTIGEEVHIIRYRAAGDPLTAAAADPASAQLVLRIPGYASVHQSGWMDFAPDGSLYIAVGDGADWNRAQVITSNLSGKILRIDVDGPDNIPGNADDDAFPDDPDRNYSIPLNNPFVGIDGDDEIWAYGLRNPWRNDIDPATGNLYISDVGQNLWEEINFQPATPPGALPGDPGYHGGRNYGWPCYEGDADHVLDGCAPAGTMTFPFLVYGHAELVPPTDASGCAVTGGVVYRGCAIPDLDGAYFFADFCSARIFSLRYDGEAVADFTDRTTELAPAAPLTLRFPCTFGRDARGEIYLCDLTGGEVFKIVPTTITDLNGDGIADTCACPADWNADGATNSGDISAFLTAWIDSVTHSTTAADYNHDGVTNSGDISAFLLSWHAAITGGC